MKIRWSVCAICATGLTGLSWQGGAVAEEAADVSGEAPPQVQEVIISARKREESDLRVPDVSADFNAAQLQTFGTEDLFDLAESVPSLVIGNNTGPFGPNLALRGIGTSSFSATADQSVSLNIDGLPINKGFAASVGLLDVAQIDILEGPQSLFFGKSSTAGVISIRSADPRDRFEAGGNVGYEKEAEQARAELFISGPIADTLRARLAVSYSDQRGFFYNIADPTPGLGGVLPKYNRAPNTRNVMSRLTVMWLPSERLEARLKGTLSRANTQGTGGLQQYAYCPPGPIDATENCHMDRYFSVADLDPKIFTDMPNGGVPFLKEDFNLGSLEVNWHITPVLTLTSISGIVNHTNSFLINGTAAPGQTDITSNNPFLQAAFAPFPVPSYGVTIGADGTLNETDLTEELRLATAIPDSPVNVMIGGFYQKGRFHQYRDDVIPIFGGHIVVDESRMETETWSGFGQVTWNIVSQLELAAGARYTDEKRSFTFTNLVTGTEIPTAVPSIEQSNVSPEVTLTFRPSEELTIFGAYKKGFKSGSFNLENSNIPPTTDLSYKPEVAKGGEFGIKTLLLARRLRIEAAVYDYKYNDLQVSQNYFSPPATNVLLTKNAATATSKGVDLKSVFAATTGLTLNAAVNYTKAQFDRFDTALCWGGQTVALGCNLAFSPAANLGLGGYTAQDLSNKDLPRAPRWAAYLGFDYQHTLGTALEYGVAASGSYTDKMYTDTSQSPGTLQGGYAKVNAAVRIFDADRRWEVAVIGNNLGNKIIAPTCFVGNEAHAGSLTPNLSGLPFTNGVDSVGCFPEQGRELWLKASYKWLGGQ